MESHGRDGKHLQQWKIVGREIIALEFSPLAVGGHG